MILEEKTIINVNEASYSRLVKQNYSWLPRGLEGAIINSKWVGSTSVIFALLSHGQWLWMISNNSTNSNRFARFLLIQQKFIILCLGEDLNNVTIILDNDLIHLSNTTKREPKFLDLHLSFLLLYSPAFSPTEWVFGVPKKMILTLKEHKWVNFSKPSGKKVLIRWMKTIDKDLGQALWLQFIRTFYIVFQDVIQKLLMNSDKD